jgi:hypothetical protein
MTALALRPSNGPPPDRGRLLTPSQVREIIGNVSEAWCRRSVPHKLTLGHSTCRHEGDVLAWLESRRGG